MNRVWPCGCPVQRELETNDDGQARKCPICGACLECGKKHDVARAFLAGATVAAIIFVMFLTCQWVQVT